MSIPFQYEVIKLIRSEFDYSRGVLELLLSGALGSSKTTLMAHLIVSHCVMFPRARALIGRRTLQDLKHTLLAKIIEHLSDLREDRDYIFNRSANSIKFANGSEILSRSWSDGNYSKIRSYEFSAAAIEEATENDAIDYYNEIKMRVGRLAHVPESWTIQATNPDSPAHPLYQYYFENLSYTRRVIRSQTSDNPFLPATYKESMARTLDPKMARRMLFGEWIEITTDRIYYAYDREHNFRDCEYTVDEKAPIIVSFDFNIAEGKPMSVVVMQYINDDILHIYDEVVIEGFRTLDALDELADKGVLNHPELIWFHGDATGKARDTRNRKSDVELISDFLANYKTSLGKNANYKVQFPLSNPPIKRRWMIVNAQCCNALGERKLFVYKTAPTADKALRLTALASGGRLAEDDTKPYQHISTAIGYGLVAQKQRRGEQRSVQL